MVYRFSSHSAHGGATRVPGSSNVAGAAGTAVLGLAFVDSSAQVQLYGAPG